MTPAPPHPRRRLASIAAALGFLLACYVFLRAVFLWMNWGTIARLPGAEVAAAFAHGPRFDLAAILLLNLPVVLLLALPLPRHGALVWVRGGLFLALNVPFLWLGMLDAEYVKFTGKRSGRDVFALKGDAIDQLGSLVAQYWPLFATCFLLTGLSVVVAVGVERTLARDPTPADRAQWRAEILSFLLVVVVCAVGIRGGFQRKPLTTTHAYLFEAGILNLLSLNSTLSVLHAGRSRGIVTPSYFPSVEEARALWERVDPDLEGTKRLVPEGEPAVSPKPGKETAAAARPNVVVVIVESLGREYMGFGNPWKGYTPFLDSLAREGLAFEDAFASGRRSIEAPWSVFAGIPSLMDEPYVTSPYKDNALVAAPRALRDAGYATAFFHGGKNGTMFFDIFSRMAGFDRYVGMSEYPEEARARDYDGTWGIFDGPFLAHAAAVMGALPEPFLAGVFTLSSHNPYVLPPGTEARYAEGTTLPIHRVVRYADDALRGFFEKASREPWFERTVFVITGDHTSTTEHEEYQDDLGFNRVPILLWSPSRTFHKGLAARVASHSDIPCSLYELARVEARSTPFCRSLLDPAFGGRTILKSGDMYNLVTPKTWIRRPADGSVTVFPRAERARWLERGPRAGSPVDAATARALSRKLDAGLQSYAGGLNEGTLFGAR